MKYSTPILAALAAIALAGPVQAQEATAADVRTELRALVTEQTPADRDRGAILDFLDRDDVEAAATGYGLDLEPLKDGVNTLGADEVRALAQRVGDTEDRLDQVGGDTFVISSTVVIIALLVIILVIVA